jgi:predicted TIM-barrel fold metal-dependent hydrolase
MQTFDRLHNRPSQPLPEHSADCHMHVFGPFDRFPLSAVRAYNVDEAPLAAHERMKRLVGLERTVLVQASGHGTDNRAMLAALTQLGPQGRAVAVVDLDTPIRDLERLQELGVSGVRLNLYTLASRHPGSDAELVAKCARAISPLGWHVQVFADPHTLVELEPVLARSSVDVVIDHMGLPEASAGVEQPVFQALLRLVRTGRVWTKLSGADRVTRHTGRLQDAIPFMQALADAAIDRLVWGSDWPNIGFHSRQQVTDDAVLPHRELDVGEMLNVLIGGVPDANARRKILSLNPERLYGFERG